jgi:hypothetical protein
MVATVLSGRSLFAFDLDGHREAHIQSCRSTGGSQGAAIPSFVTIIRESVIDL